MSAHSHGHANTHEDIVTSTGVHLRPGKLPQFYQVLLSDAKKVKAHSKPTKKSSRSSRTTTKSPKKIKRKTKSKITKKHGSSAGKPKKTLRKSPSSEELANNASDSSTSSSNFKMSRTTSEETDSPVMLPSVFTSAVMSSSGSQCTSNTNTRSCSSDDENEIELKKLPSLDDHAMQKAVNILKRQIHEDEMSESRSSSKGETAYLAPPSDHLANSFLLPSPRWMDQIVELEAEMERSMRKEKSKTQGDGPIKVRRLKKTGKVKKKLRIPRRIVGGTPSPSRGSRRTTRRHLQRRRRRKRKQKPRFASLKGKDPVGFDAHAIVHELERGSLASTRSGPEASASRIRFRRRRRPELPATPMQQRAPVLKQSDPKYTAKKALCIYIVDVFNREKTFNHIIYRRFLRDTADKTNGTELTFTEFSSVFQRVRDTIAYLSHMSETESSVPIITVDQDVPFSDGEVDDEDIWLCEQVSRLSRLRKEAEELWVQLKGNELLNVLDAAE